MSRATIRALTRALDRTDTLATDRLLGAGLLLIVLALALAAVHA